jgi:phage baseplate assembly protein gpV
MSKTKLTLAAAFLAIAAVACGGDSAEPRVAPEEEEQEEAATYDDNGVTFEYPGEWDEFPAEASATSTGSNELWSATVGPDKTNLVNITAYQLNIEVTEENLDSIEAELDQVIKGVVDQAGGSITSGPDQDEVAGFPAYTYTWTNVEVEGEPKDSSAYFIFDGDTEYFFNCQFSDETQDEVQSGCDQVLASFSVTDSA